MTTEPTPAHGTSEGITAKPPETATSTGIVENPAMPTPAVPTAPPPDWALRTDYVLLGLLLALSFFVASFTASNSDLWMHLATGKRISEGKFEFGVDPFSWATETRAVPWIHHSWLYSWLVYQIHESRLGGAGLVLIKAILFTLAIGLLSRIGWTPQNRWFLLICLVMAVLATSSRLFMQPMVVSLLFLAITLYVLDRGGVFALNLSSSSGREAADVRCLWCLPPLFALWANLDAWFILGPLILGLVWAASGLTRWFGAPLAAPGKTLGMVFGAGVLACLVNPYHVRVFQLPPELAYLVLAVADPLHVPLPAEMIAGGRALKELRGVEPDFSWTMSSLVSDYWGQTRFGKNIAGLAFYPLVLLGVLGFTLAALVRPQKDAPTFQVARFLVWLVFAVMALAMYRMIPFFVLIAAPLTAMTLGEFLVWQQTSAEIPLERRDRGLKFARFVTAPFLLLLIYLAWPGWLHGSTEFNSVRRVAWDTRVAPSLQKAAEALQTLKANGEGQNVFNGDIDLGNVLPWFAPEVKHAFDSRLALFAGHVPTFGKVRDALNGDKDDIDWRTLFAERQVDQIAMTNFLMGDNSRRILRWWLAPHAWRERYGDRRMAVFSWAPKKPWPTKTFTEDLNRQAFGDVPADRRPPAPTGATTPTPSMWSLYLYGVGPQPAALAEIDLHQLRFSVVNQVVHGSQGALNARGCRLIGLCASLTGLQSLPGGGMAMEPAFLTAYYSWAVASPGELGPPAIPVLIVRLARQAVAENPLDVQAHLALLEANEGMRRNQEDRWINYQPGRNHPSPLRDRLRQIQQIAGLVSAIQLQPDSHLHHDRLAKLYLQQNMVDLALEHMQLAEKALEAQRLNVSADRMKDFDAAVKEYHGEVDSLDKNVKQRVAKWKEISTGQSAFMKARLAYEGVFDMLMRNQAVRTPLGLGKKAIELLGAVEPESLDAKERLPFVQLRFDLLVSMGRVDLLSESLADERVRKSMPPHLHGQYALLVAAALGDYPAVDPAIESIESAVRGAMKAAREKADERGKECVLHAFAAGTQQTSSTMAYTLVARTIPAIMQYTDTYIEGQGFQGELANAMTLHGILLLEVGDTKKARERFGQAMSEGEGTPFFADRAIARRYLQLLDETRKR